eukprot:2878731-Rhodomonas_salina.2
MRGILNSNPGRYAQEALQYRRRRREEKKQRSKGEDPENAWRCTIYPGAYQDPGNGTGFGGWCTEIFGTGTVS